MHLRAAAGTVRLVRLMRRSARHRDSTLNRQLRHITAVLITCLLLTPALVRAQVPATHDTARVRLDSLQVIVTRSAVAPERSPTSIWVVERAAIQDGRPTVTLDEALAAVPGLVVSNRHNFSLGPRIIMRGMGARAAFGVRGVRVLVDGVPLTMPDGQTNLNNLDLGSAGSIHVLRGPASALFGNAAAGVIAVETETAPGPFATETRLITGDQGRGDMTRFLKVQTKIGQTVRGVDYIASLARMEVDGYRDHARTRQTLFNGRARVMAGSATRLSFVVNAIDMPVADSPGALPLEQARAEPTNAWPNNIATHSGETTRQAQLGVRLQHAGQHGHADVSVYAITRSLDNALPFGFIQLHRAAGGLRASYEHTFATLPAAPALVAGVDVEAQRDERREFANQAGEPVGVARRDQQDRVTGVGPFAQIRGRTGALELTIGARYDAVRFEVDDRRGSDPDRSGGRTLDALSPMIGATWALPHVTLFANVASAFQTPTTTELINAPPAAGEPCCPAGFNPQLEPQRARSTEIGARAGWGTALHGTVSLYRMDVRDALVPFQVPEVEGRDFFRNAARTRHQGVELSASLLPLPGVVLNAAFAWTDVRFRADPTPGDHLAGNRVPGIPARRAHASLSWNPGRYRLSVDVDHTGEQHTNDANTAAAPAVTRIDLRAEWSMRAAGAEFTPFVVLNNALDQRYFGSISVNAVGARYYEPAPGRNVYAGVSVRTGAWRR
jgi:iron complex outermembrane recepter protein